MAQSLLRMICARPTKMMMVMLFASCASQQFSTASGSTAQAADAFSSFPFVVGCEYKGTFHAYYLSRVTPEGVATYVASEKIAGTITLDGHAKAVGGSTGGSCVGKTLAELRASGQAHDLK
ncbi:hypothetical protein [Neorhizobium sp. P12A]|uniref:hypothetical protein n=1 Tax=Neorhizobium sp. P12A TaxID=2268027 RepID=UPI001FF019B6|nr:hypothetical protein [Neorhizobium sp. P12A]